MSAWTISTRVIRKRGTPESRAGALARAAGQTSSTAQLLVILLLMAGMMVVVGLIATIGPARRALRVQPSEVLKAEWRGTAGEAVMARLGIHDRAPSASSWETSVITW